MVLTIESLPYEVISLVLEAAALSNARESAIFTYGLSQAPLPLQKSPLERTVRGHKPLDTLRWDSVRSFREVNSRWHHWTLSYAMKELYIRRWRGSERWVESRGLQDLTKQPSSLAVYREPYNALKSTASLLLQNPITGNHIRRLWFVGFYTLETSQIILDILGHCKALQSVTLPWTILRYCDAKAWQNVLTQANLSCLELTAIGLKESQASDPQNQVDLKPLDNGTVNFANLRRLRIVGNTNFMPITDEDLSLIAKSACNLRELHVTGISSISSAGVMRLVEASRARLEVLEYSPLCDGGFDHPRTEGDDSGHQCQCGKVGACERLTDITLSLPSICSKIFHDHSVEWAGNVHLRAASICGLDRDAHNPLTISHVLDSCRALANARRVESKEINIELFLANWLFEPKARLVHGTIAIIEEMSSFTWPLSKSTSFKGPYGQTGLYGKAEGPYSCVSEEEFFEGLRQGHISL